MSILVVGSVAFDALQTPFGKVDRCIGGSATYFSVGNRGAGAEEDNRS